MKLCKQQSRWCIAAAAGFLLLSACVTVNIYFPAAAAEQAAGAFVKDVLGEEAQKGGKPQSRLGSERAIGFWKGLLDILVPPAQAQDFNINTPAINRLKNTMSARIQRLEPHFDTGALGFTRDGLVAIRDLNAIPLKDRAAVKQLVQQENVDRNALYREVAVANGHPEWESQVRSTFAKQWIDNARPGWWVEGPGGWRRK